MKPAREGKLRDWPEVRVFRTLLRAEHRVRQEHKRLDKALGHTLSQIDLIMALGNTEGMRMGDLAKALITSPANVTRLCVQLEKEGLAQRQRSDASDRVVIARLTESGEARFEAIHHRVANYTQAMIASALDEEECLELSRLLDKLASARGPDEI